MWLNLRAPLAYAVFAFCVFFGWLAAHWPGLFIYDTFVNLDNAWNGELIPWVSIPYSAYLILLTKISRDPAFIGVFQICVAVAASACIFSWMYKRAESRWVVIVSFAFFVLSPLNGIMNIFYTRDWLFSWSLCVLAVYYGSLLFSAKWEDRRPTLWHVVLLMIGVCLTATIRQDAIVLAVLVPLLFFFHFRKERKAVFAMAILSLIVLAISSPRLPYFRDRTDNFYALTGIINPLSYILVHSYVTEDAENDRQVIGRVLDIQKLTTVRDDYEIPAFHQGVVKSPVSDSDLAAVRRKYLEIVLNNPGLFLTNRIRMWNAIMGNKHSMFYTDALKPEDLPSQNVPEQLRHLSKAPLSSGLNTFANRLMFDLFEARGPVSLFLRSAWPAFFLLVMLLAMFRAFPISASVAAIVLCRVPVVFLGAPAAQFKYVYSVYLMAFFLIPLLYIENSSKKRDHNSARRQPGTLPLP